MSNLSLRNVLKLLTLLLLFNCLAFPQLKKMTFSNPNIKSSVDIYLDNNGSKYSNYVLFNFKNNIMNLSRDVRIASVDKIKLPQVQDFINNLIKKYGEITLEKVVPSAIWGDTIRINKRTKEKVHIHDMSQLFRLEFPNLAPVDSIVEVLKNLPGIEFAQSPIPQYLTSSPNDPYYQDANYRWSFDAINATQAWDITKGSSDIRVSLNDLFGSLGQVHEDLVGKVVYRFNSSASGGHGTETAGIVGAITDNNLDVASLGWNTSVMFNSWYDSINEVYSAISNGADVINFSWVSFYYNDYLAKAISDALDAGVVCVASSGNNETPIPYLRYPAAYNFGTIGQVIAVSGTELNNGVEQRIANYNFCQGTDPVSDSTAFIDFTGPAAYIRGLSNISTTETMHLWQGTSYSTPMVSALAALMLSINDALTPNQVYDILKHTADKVGADPYIYDNGTWNQYLGYGRINAYKALKYTLEHFGATLTQDVTIPSGETWNFDAGSVIKFNPGISLTINGSVNQVKGTAVGKTIDHIAYYFNNWSTGSTNTTETFNNPINTTITANFEGIPAENMGVWFEASNPRAPITIHWDEYPNQYVTKYQIWRKVKYQKGTTSDPQLIATVNRGTTSYTDNDYMGTNQGFTDWMLWYDVRPYYSVEGTYAQPSYNMVFSGGIFWKSLGEMAITENKIENYPNPFNPETVIRYQIIKSGPVSIKVYDITGREIMTLVNEEKNQGRYEVKFDASSLSSGIYFYRITANGFNDVKKMILMK